MNRSYEQLSDGERGMIMGKKLQGHRAGSIARTLQRAPSTITRESGRSGFEADAELDTIGRPRIAGGYDVVRAGARSRRVRRRARRLCKLHFEGALWRKVRALMAQCWSPEQIAGTQGVGGAAAPR